VEEEKDENEEDFGGRKYIHTSPLAIDKSYYPRDYLSLFPI
jgi:hypothetical protein